MHWRFGRIAGRGDGCGWKEMHGTTKVALHSRGGRQASIPSVSWSPALKDEEGGGRASLSIGSQERTVARCGSLAGVLYLHFHTGNKEAERGGAVDGFFIFELGPGVFLAVSGCIVKYFDVHGLVNGYLIPLKIRDI
jgi:hypothetical protein